MTDTINIGKAAGTPGRLHYLDMAFSGAHTTRFHMVRTQRRQSITEHSARVAHIFRVLLVKWVALAEEPNSLTDSLNWPVVEWYGLLRALDHDLAETLTGDMPGHMKTPAVKTAMDAAEDQVLDMLDDKAMVRHLHAPYGAISAGEWALARQLVKLADITEGFLFAYGNQGLGPTTHDPKQHWILQGLTDMFKAHLATLRVNAPSGFVAWADHQLNIRFNIITQHL